jgi:TolB-like protein/Flp pilus assembly protein TadD
MSNGSEQQYFADGITEDLTTDLSRIAGMFVISRNTAFFYKNNSVNTKQIGRELGVRYVLEGSVQRSGNQVRVNAQLIDAATDAHLWTERFDRDTADLFAIQDEIISRIANALRIELIAAEAARPTERPDALDYILRGRATAAKPRSPDNWANMISLFEQALAVNPASVEAHSRLASALATRFAAGMSHLPVADIERADALVEQALMLSPRDALPHYAKGQVLRAQNRYGEAAAEFETVLALDRNSVDACFALGQCKLLTGSIDETIPLTERAIRLSPRDGQIFNWHWQIGSVHLLQSRVDEAIHWLEKARNANPQVAYVRSYLAAAYALSGQSDLAATELAETRRLNIDGRFLAIARLVGAGTWGVPEIRALYEATYFTGLRKAGVPEE